MSYDLIDRKDQRIDTIFKGLENMERMIDAIRTAPRPAFHSDYFLTDEELSKLLKVSRRTLQEYRTLGVIPYYLVQGKALYKESDECAEILFTVCFMKDLHGIGRITRIYRNEYCGGLFVFRIHGNGL